jgi:hypothetical protein
MAAMTPTPDDGPTVSPPVACDVAFKEWSGVCRALLDGRQALILRKGGIEEGPGGFRPEHPAFWLYPTRVHQAQQGLQAGGDTEDELHDPPGFVGLPGLAVVSSIGEVREPDRLAALNDLHVWTAETVEARFRYRRLGLWVLGVRVFRRREPILLPLTPEQAGCKSWVPLGSPLSTTGVEPVLGATEFRETMRRLAEATGRGGGEVPKG